MGDIAIDLIEEKQKSETEHLFYFRTVANMKVQVVTGQVNSCNVLSCVPARDDNCSFFHTIILPSRCLLISTKSTKTSPSMLLNLVSSCQNHIF